MYMHSSVPSLLQYFELFAQLQLFQMSAALYPASYAPHPGLEYWLRHTPVYTDKERWVTHSHTQTPTQTPHSGG